MLISTIVTKLGMFLDVIEIPFFMIVAALILIIMYKNEKDYQDENK